MRRHIFAVLDAPDVPCDVFESPGAFYYFLRVHTDLDSMTLAERLVREHRVAAIPGSAFGMHDGCYLRISYGALDGERARDGVERLVKGLRGLAG
jgi:aspartate/methionine/tyrosine aminotransferase